MNMRNKHVTRFGDPTTFPGAVYVVSDEEGLFQTAVDLEYLRLYVDDIPIMSILEERVQDRVRREQLLLHHKLSSLGIPENLKSLFEITSKSECEKYCKNLHFTEFEFFLLIHNCGQINFTHQSKFPEHVPSHLNLPKIGSENWKQQGLRRITRKSDAILRERRRIHVHFFERDAQWHCFYFSYTDIPSDDTSHWKHGDHLHYVSHLWPKYSKDSILPLFETRRTNISDSLHIRFSPFEYAEHFSASDDIPESIFDWQPMLIAINANLASSPNLNLNPIPTAQLATRGFWSFEISPRPNQT